jgi:hypothetical protein
MSAVVHTFHCGVCYKLDTAELRWDKYGRPWLHCFACGARTFTRNPDAVKGFRHTSRLVEAALRMMAGDPAEREAREQDCEAFAERIRAERDKLTSNGFTRPEVDSHVVEQAIPVAATK